MKADNLNLFVVDDGKEERESIATLFIARNYRVQVFESGEAFLARADTQSHGCVILDVKMDPGMSGLQVFDELRRINSPLVVILNSGHLSVRIAAGYTKKGAFDCLEKGHDDARRVECVAAAMEHAANTAAAFEKVRAVKLRWNTLTPREMDVARCSRRGWPNNLVADELGMGVRTAETHRRNVYRKLWVSNPTELDRLMRENAIE